MCVPVVTPMSQHQLTQQNKLDPMTHKGFGDSRLNKDKSTD